VVELKNDLKTKDAKNKYKTYIKFTKNSWAASLLSQKGIKFLQITAGCLHPMN